MTAMPLQPFTAAETAHLARIEAAEPVDAGQDARVETVARAICAADEFVDGDTWTWDDAGENAHAEYRRMATAALAAMHPADETLRAAEPPCKVGDPDPTIHPGRYCSVEEWEDGFVCTRETGHPADWHIAGDSVQVCAVWPVAVLGGEL